MIIGIAATIEANTKRPKNMKVQPYPAAYGSSFAATTEIFPAADLRKVNTKDKKNPQRNPC
jgi:hypothetical protein